MYPIHGGVIRPGRFYRSARPPPRSTAAPRHHSSRRPRSTAPPPRSPRRTVRALRTLPPFTAGLGGTRASFCRSFTHTLLDGTYATPRDGLFNGAGSTQARTRSHRHRPSPPATVSQQVSPPPPAPRASLVVAPTPLQVAATSRTISWHNDI